MSEEMKELNDNELLLEESVDQKSMEPCESESLENVTEGNTIKKGKRYYILAFVLPFVAMFIGYIFNEVFPFGKKCILCSDLYNQYLPFYADLRDTLKNNGSLLYSWHMGLGSNFIPVYAYYLASPFNWLLVLVPFDYLIEFMTILIMLKIGLCGLTFSYYLSKKFNRNDFSISVFSMFYALCGFVGAYNWDIMWLDVLVLAPLVILGLEMLVREKKWKLYCFTLALSIVFNYYIAMILCIFLVFYFAVVMLTLPKKLFEPAHMLGAIGRFTVFSLLAAGMAAVILFPVASALTATKYANNAFPEKLEFYFQPFEAFARHFINVDTEIGQEHWPNLYCGVGIFFMIPMFLLAKKISVREKIFYSALMIFFLFSFSINKLAFLWHGLNYPNCLPSRQSYLYDFVLVTLCYQVYINYKEEKWWKYLISGIVAAGLVAGCIVVSLPNRKEFPDYSFQLTIIFVILEFIIFLLHQKLKYRKITALIAFIILFAEVTTNMTVSGILTSTRANYVKDRKDYIALLDEVENLEGDDFYRVENRGRRTKNDAMYIGYQSSTMFSSTTEEHLQKFYYELGSSSSKVFYANPTGTPLFNSMLGIRYLFAKEDDLSNPFYHLIDSKGEISLYQYTYTLPLGYMLPTDIDEKWDYTEGTPITAQNSFVNALGIDGSMLIKQENVLNESGQTTFNVSREGYYYVYVAYKYVDKIKMKVTDQDGTFSTRTFEQVQNDYLLDCGYCTDGTELFFEPKEDGEEDCNMELRIYRLQEPLLQEAIEKMSEQTMEVTSYSDTKVEGHIVVWKEGKLVTSIPYETGWTLYVDGKETEIETFADTMIAVNLKEGEHTLRFEFYPKGLSKGIVVSIASSAIFIILCVLSSFNKAKKKRKIEEM